MWKRSKKIIKNKHEKSFGLAGSFAGILLFILGLFFLNPVLLLLGAFFGFSYTCTHIDYENKRIKFLNVIFGLIPFGKWVEVKSHMKISIRKNVKTWKTMSMSNRTIGVEKGGFVVFIRDSLNNEIMMLQYANNLDDARDIPKMIIGKFEFEIG